MNPTPSSQCQLLDHFAIGVQSFMALIALSSLFYKRHREHPRRPLNIWLLDVSKQALGGLLVHSCNVFFSLLAVSASTFQNPCILYFLNVLVDTTVGVLILIFFLKVYHAGYHRCVHERMVMGYYGHPPQWKPWLIQTGLFSCSLFSMKLVVVVLLKLVPGLETLGNWVLSPFHHQPQFEEVFVMLLFPLTMNVVQFWLIDQVIKYPLHSEYSSLHSSSSTPHPPVSLFPSSSEFVYPNRRSTSSDSLTRSSSTSSDFSSTPLPTTVSSSSSSSFNETNLSHVYLLNHPGQKVSMTTSISQQPSSPQPLLKRPHSPPPLPSLNVEPIVSIEQHSPHLDS